MLKLATSENMGFWHIITSHWFTSDCVLLRSGFGLKEETKHLKRAWDSKKHEFQDTIYWDLKGKKNMVWINHRNQKISNNLYYQSFHLLV